MKKKFKKAILTAAAGEKDEKEDSQIHNYMYHLCYAALMHGLQSHRAGDV